MRLTLLSTILLCWATVNFAQHLDAGLGVGFRTLSTGSMEIDSLTVEINNSNDNRFLVPQFSFTAPLSEKWGLNLSIAHQSGGISLRAFDAPSDSCSLCPVKKGGLVSYREIPVGTSLTFVLFSRGDFKLRAGMGVVYTFRYNQEASPARDLKRVSNNVRYVLGNARSIAEKNYLSTQLSAEVSWRKWTFYYQYNRSAGNSVVDEIKTPAGNFSLDLDQKLSLAGMRFRIMTF